MTEMNSHYVERLFRPELITMQPYVPIHPFEVISQRLNDAGDAPAIVLDWPTRMLCLGAMAGVLLLGLAPNSVLEAISASLPR